MPYTIRKSTKKGDKRPYKIVNKQTGKIVGTSRTRKNAVGSIAHRMSGEKKNVKKWKRETDNKMRSYGEVDYDKMKVRINKSKKKNKKKGEIINTIVHERQHIKHPKKHEKTIRKDTKKEIAKMSLKQKLKAYHLFPNKKRHS
jgi:hypothetical protein